MHYSLMRIFKHKRKVAIGILILFALALSPIVLTDVKSLQIRSMGPTEVTWQTASKGCTSIGKDWSLPSIYQLAALYYRYSDIELIENTDYWSHNAITGFAFGLNTGRGIASFDRFADTDHYVCINSSNP